MDFSEDIAYRPASYTMLECPFCGDTKKVFNLICDNPYTVEYWSDTRRVCPDLPVIFPIQKCARCGKYYFIQEDQYHYVDMDAEVETLSYSQLKEALRQFSRCQLTDWEKESLYLELFKEYNHVFRSGDPSATPVATEEDILLFNKAIHILLHECEIMPHIPLLKAELLRESGYFEEAETLLRDLLAQEYDWMAKGMLDATLARDTRPFLLIKDGDPLYD